MPERRFTFVRHASTVYNDLHLLNGDPRVPVPLDAAGRVAAAALAPRARALPVRSRPAHALRAHARDTDAHARPAARRADRGRARFDDIDVGDLRGAGRRRPTAPGAPSTGRASRCPAARAACTRSARYADGCARLLARYDARCVLLVVHDVPIRFLRNAMLGADPLEGPVRTVANLERVSVSQSQLAAGLAVMRRRFPAFRPSTTAVLAAHDRHRVPVVIARYHNCRSMMTDHDAQQATHVTNMPAIATTCPSALAANPSKG